MHWAISEKFCGPDGSAVSPEPAREQVYYLKDQINIKSKINVNVPRAPAPHQQNWDSDLISPGIRGLRTILGNFHCQVPTQAKGRLGRTTCLESDEVATLKALD